MKIRKKATRSGVNLKQKTGEEFFQLPRAEFLMEEVRENEIDQIGDLATNPSVHVSNRFTLLVMDNCMVGADIREGDYVVVEVQPGYPEGCLLAVQLGNQRLVRRYTRVEGRIHLHCDPPGKQVIIVEEHTPDFHILGQVVQVIREIK